MALAHAICLPVSTIELDCDCKVAIQARGESASFVRCDREGCETTEDADPTDDNAAAEDEFARSIDDCWRKRVFSTNIEKVL